MENKDNNKSVPKNNVASFSIVTNAIVIKPEFIEKYNKIQKELREKDNEKEKIKEKIK